MAQIKDIIYVERRRETREQWLTIHLFREGSFFRAWEWSARLCVLYVSDKLKVSHKQSRKNRQPFAAASSEVALFSGCCRTTEATRFACG